MHPDILSTHLRMLGSSSVLEAFSCPCRSRQLRSLVLAAHAGCAPASLDLQGSFQTDHKLYLILDFVNGGHLFFQLRKQGTFSEDLCRLYAAELVLALAHLHSMDIGEGPEWCWLTEALFVCHSDSQRCASPASPMRLS